MTVSNCNICILIAIFHDNCQRITPYSKKSKFPCRHVFYPNRTRPLFSAVLLKCFDLGHFHENHRKYAVFTSFANKKFASDSGNHPKSSPRQTRLSFFCRQSEISTRILNVCPATRRVIFHVFEDKKPFGSLRFFSFLFPPTISIFLFSECFLGVGMAAQSLTALHCILLFSVSFQ